MLFINVIIISGFFDTVTCLEINLQNPSDLIQFKSLLEPIC